MLLKSNVAQTQVQDSIVIVGWVPKGLGNVVKTLPSADLRPGSPFDLAGLSLYKAKLFPFEGEITLKGGLFPHYILGYLHWKNGNEIFEVNPALFEVGKDWDGKELPIDQSSWGERIQSTEFGAYFQLHDDRAFSQWE